MENARPVRARSTSAVLMRAGQGAFRSVGAPVSGSVDIFYAKTQAEVVDKLAEARAKLKAGLPIDGPPPVATPRRDQVVSEVLGAWLALIKPEIKPHTWTGYEGFIRIHALPMIGSIPADRITTVDIVELIREKVATGMAPNSLKHLRTVLKSAFSWACESGLMSSNPAAAKKLGLPRLTQRRAQFLDEEQARRLLSAASGHRLYPLISLALHTGARKGELLGAKWSDFDLDNATFTITRTLQRFLGRGLNADTTKTPASNRTVHLAPSMVKTLISHRREQAAERLSAGAAWSDGGWVFTTPTGQPLDPSNLHKSWKAIVAKAGMGSLHFHDLRSTAGSLLLNNQVGLKEVSAMLGHSSIRITADVYAGIYESTSRQVANTLGAVLGKK